MSDFTIKQSDTLPVLSATLKDAAGAAIDLTGATVTFRMRRRGRTGPLKIDAAATVVSALAGTVQYAWASGDTDTPGSYDAEFRLTLPAGQETVPNGNNLDIEVVSAV